MHILKYILEFVRSVIAWFVLVRATRLSCFPMGVGGPEDEYYIDIVVW